MGAAFGGIFTKLKETTGGNEDDYERGFTDGVNHVKDMTMPDPSNPAPDPIVVDDGVYTFTKPYGNMSAAVAADGGMMPYMSMGTKGTFCNFNPTTGIALVIETMTDDDKCYRASLWNLKENAKIDTYDGIDMSWNHIDKTNWGATRYNYLYNYQFRSVDFKWYIYRYLNPDSPEICKLNTVHSARTNYTKFFNYTETGEENIFTTCIPTFTPN